MNDDSEIITLLQDSAAHFINDNQETPSITATLALMGEQGWPSLALSEGHDGSGLGLQAITAMSFLFGQAAYTTPFIGQCVMPAILLNHADKNGLVSTLCEQLSLGETALAFAWQENTGQLPSSASQTTLENGVLNGNKQFVAGAAYAEQLLVSATINGTACVIAINKECEGVSITTEFDSSLGFANISFNNVAIADSNIILQGDIAEIAINKALSAAQIALAAELAGLANGCLSKTLEYIKTRTQFKQALGSFQAIRHRCADMFMANKLADTSWQRAVREYNSGSANLNAQTHAAKARCADAAFKVAKESIQMHGAMGFTEEAGIGNYMRAALGLSSWLGSAQQHRHELMLSSREEA